MKLAPIIERMMLGLDDEYYKRLDLRQRIIADIIDEMSCRAARLCDKWQRQNHDCPSCDGIINVLMHDGTRRSEHTEDCTLQNGARCSG